MKLRNKKGWAVFILLIVSAAAISYGYNFTTSNATKTEALHVDNKTLVYLDLHNIANSSDNNVTNVTFLFKDNQGFMYSSTVMNYSINEKIELIVPNIHNFSLNFTHNGSILNYSGIDKASVVQNNSTSVVFDKTIQNISNNSVNSSSYNLSFRNKSENSSVNTSLTLNKTGLENHSNESENSTQKSFAAICINETYDINKPFQIILNSSSGFDSAFATVSKNTTYFNESLEKNNASFQSNFLSFMDKGEYNLKVKLYNNSSLINSLNKSFRIINRSANSSEISNQSSSANFTLNNVSNESNVSNDSAKNISINIISPETGQEFLKSEKIQFIVDANSSKPIQEVYIVIHWGDGEIKQNLYDFSENGVYETAFFNAISSGNYNTTLVVKTHEKAKHVNCSFSVKGKLVPGKAKKFFEGTEFITINSRGNKLLKDARVFVEKSNLSIEKNKAIEKAFEHKKRIKKLKVKDVTNAIKSMEFHNIKTGKSIDLGVEDLQREEFTQSFAIDPTKVNFSNAIVNITATGTKLYKCAEWNFSERKCYGEWKLLKDNLVPGKTYSINLTKKDPAFGEMKIEMCRAQNLASSPSTWGTLCDNTYPGSALFYDDSNYEVHSIEKQGGTTKWAGLRINSSNSSVNNCDEIKSVKFCYKWWASTTRTTSCDISIDSDKGASYSTLTTACPANGEPTEITCVDVTTNENWQCSNFFGPSATGAMAKSELVSSGAGGNGVYDVYWDVFYFNVTYIDNPPSWSNNKINTVNVYNSEATSQFNITWQDNVAVDTAYFESNFTGQPKNYTMDNSSSPAFIFEKIMPAGSFYWKSYANDTIGNWSSSDVWHFSIEKAEPTLALSADPGWSSVYGQTTNITCTAANPEVTPRLYRNGTYVGQSDVNVLAASSYNYTCNSTPTQNYTSTSTSSMLGISRAEGLVNLYLNSTRTNRTISNNTYINITGVLNSGAGNISLYLNDSSIANDHPPLTKHMLFDTVAMHKVTANYSGNKNYTSDSEVWWINVTPGPPPDFPPTWIANKSTIQSPYNIKDSVFNITWKDDNGVEAVYIETNKTGAPVNYTMNLDGASEYTYSNPFPAGSFYWKSYAKDNAGSWSSSDEWGFVIEKADPGLSLISDPGWTLTYGTESNISCVASTLQSNPTLYRNTTKISGFFDLQTLDAGIYNYTCNATETENYTSSEISQELIVNKANSEVMLYLNNKRNNIVVENDSVVDVQANLTNGTGNITLTKNNSIVYQGAPPYSESIIFNKTTTYTITANYSGAENFNPDSESWQIKVTPIPPVSKKITVNNCDAENAALNNGTFNTACDFTYPGPYLFYDDNDFETHQVRKQGGSYYWAGLRTNNSDSSIDKCVRVESVKVCYKSWSATNYVDSCYVAVDADNGSSYSIATTQCPTTGEPLKETCIDVTDLEDWDCESFFSQNSQAMLKSELKSSGGENTYYDVYWDIFHFNVSYVEDITPPNYVDFKNQSVEFSQPLYYNINATDSHGVSSYKVNDSRFKINQEGVLENNSQLQRGEYNLNITATDNFNNSNSKNLKIHVVDTTPPSPVENIIINSTGYDWAYVSWQNPPEDDFSHSELLVNNSFVVNTTMEEFNISSLQPGTNYNIGVSTTDMYRNKGEPTNITLQTLENSLPFVDFTPVTSYVGKNWAEINFSVFDSEGQRMNVEIFGDNNEPEKTNLIAKKSGLLNSSKVSFNWSAPTIDAADCLYHFDNRSEFGENLTTVNDFGGQANNAICTEATCPAIVDGKIGLGRYFDGSDVFDLGANIVFDEGFNEKTIQLWYKADTLTGTQMLFEEGSQTDGLNVYLHEGHIYAGAWTESNGFNGEWLNLTTTSGKWHHVGVVFNGNNNFTLIQDDKLVSAAIPTTMASHTGDNILGRNGGTKTHLGADTSIGEYFSGTIDEFSVHLGESIPVSNIKENRHLEFGTYFLTANVTDGFGEASYDLSFILEPGAQAIYTNFTGNTTDFNSLNDPENVTNATIHSPENAMIVWQNPVNATSQNFDKNLILDKNLVFVNSSGLDPSFNSPATLTLMGIDWEYPLILKDGEICSSCNIASYNNGNLVFKVEGFSSYSSIEGTGLNIYDDTKIDTVRSGKINTFYANYTNLSNNAPIYGPDTYCSFSDNSSGTWSSPVNMSYNFSSGIYEYNKSFNQGTYIYNISCYNKQGYANLSNTDDFFINESLFAPEIISLSPSENSFSLFSSVSITANITDPNEGDYVDSVVLNISAPHFFDSINLTTPVGSVYNYTLLNTTKIGRYNYTFYANDSYGLFSTYSSYFEIIDSEKPAAKILEPLVGNALATGTKVNITANVTDNYEVMSVSAQVETSNSTSEVVLEDTDGDDIYNASYFAYETGVNNITIIARDTSGNINDSETTWVDISHLTTAAIYCDSSPCIAGSDLIRSRDSLSTPEPNQPNTLDTCTDGSSGSYQSDESLDNISMRSLNGSTFRGGDTVEVNITAYCYDSSSDNINFIYANDSSSLDWSVAAYEDPCPVSGFYTSTRTFTLDKKTGIHALRGSIQYQGSSTTTCGSGNYDDNDDIEFYVQKAREKNKPYIDILEPDKSTHYYSDTISINANVTDESDLERVYAVIQQQGNQWEINLTDYDFNNIYTAEFSNTYAVDNYSIDVYAEDEFGNHNSEGSWFMVNDTGTLVVDALGCSPNPGDQGGWVVCSCNVSDVNVDIGEVVANVTLPNGTVLTQPTTNESSIYEFNFTSTSKTGDYSVSWWANNTNGVYKQDYDSFSVIEHNLPYLELLSPFSGQKYNTSQMVNLTVNATDDTAIDSVIADIELPDSSYNAVELSNIGGDLFFNEFTNTSVHGIYDITFIANDTFGNQKSLNSWINVSYVAQSAKFCDSSPCIVGSNLIESRDNIGSVTEPNQPNTIDSCSDGTSGSYASDESLENITMRSLNGSTFRGGDTVEVNITAYCYDSSSDNINFIYANDSSSLDWSVAAYEDPCPVSGFYTSTRTFTLDKKTGIHALRGSIQYQGSSTTTCGSGNYDDNDDIEFYVQKAREKNKPYIDILEPDKSTHYYSDTISINANVTDESDLERVYAVIQQQGNQWEINLTDYDFNNIYTAEFSNTYAVDNYSIDVYAEDEFGNHNSEGSWFMVNDTGTLVVDALGCSPVDVFQNDSVECSCNVSDVNVNISDVVANVTFPDGTTQTQDIYNLSTIYKFTFNSTSQIGDFSVHWWAN
ncbi:MAG: hypothetical protein ACQESF_05575, partial [Nanobdellota archaeon]